MEDARGDRNSPGVVVGPDLNPTKSPFDKKEYRQVMLPNGLRVVLVCDTVAMTQSYNSGGIYMEDDDDEDGSDEDDDDAPAPENDGSAPDVGPGNDQEDGDSETGSAEEGDDDEVDRGFRVAAAAMVVGVGSMSDPPECQGLAHFLEHLLFMGSEKYPEENAYDAFMSKHGGSDNAYTELEYTVYHFEIPQEYLAKGLDMFAQFFTSPLMLESSVERELSAIESEFQLVKNSDGSRVQHLMSHTCGQSTKDHPFAKFSWGNLDSLREIPKKQNIDPMKELKKFYHEHYYASNMSLVVIGGYPLDVLQEHVVKSFSDVPSNGKQNSWAITTESPFKIAGMPFTPSSLQKVYYVAPVGDRHGLSVTWQVPPQLGNWRSKPTDYLAHLIGHEAKGSLLAALKAKSWATACCAGVGAEGYENSSSHALFIVSFTLSEEGVAYWQDVVSMIYTYIGMLRYHCANGLPDWIFEELRSIQEVSYRYDDEQSPEDLVESLADELAPCHPLPADRLLDGTSLLFEYEPEKIKSLIDTYLLPENARIDLVSTTLGRSADYESVEPSVATTPLPPANACFDPTKGPAPQQEPIFGTYFWCQEIEKSKIKEWQQLAEPKLPIEDCSLDLPPRNHFIPTNFDLKPLPPTDCDHPLLNCSIKLQVTVGKRKQWFPATVTKYDSLKNKVLLSYEDEDEKWHKVDDPAKVLTHSRLMEPNYEGTMDSKAVKYRVIALASEGKGALRKFGDESDLDAEDGIKFPPIRPPSLPSRLPQLICNTQLLKLWHLQDRSFKRPTAELRLQFNCANANKSPLHLVCADLLVHLVSDALTETAYLASVCELGSSLSVNDSGLAMRVHGFDDKLLDLFFIMFDLLMEFRGRSDCKLPETIQEGRFELCVQSYKRQCANSGMKAGKLVSGLRVRCLRPTTWSANKKLKAIENLDISTFMKITTEILSKFGIEAIYHGNVSKEEAQVAQKDILSRLERNPGGGGLSRKKYPQQHVLRVPSGSNTLKCFAKDPNDPNSAVEVYYQVGKDNTEDRVMVDLLMEMMYEPLYDQIRTKDQFGYSVSCDARWTNGVIGMQFQVVTSSKTAQEAEDRIDKFIKDYRETIVDMKHEDLMQHMIGLAQQKLDMFNSLREETNHHWSEIRDGRYLWDVDREEVLCLSSFTKAEVLAAYDKWLAPEGTSRCRFAVQVVKREDMPDGETEQHVEEFNDAQVDSFHKKKCKNQTFGRIY